MGNRLNRRTIAILFEKRSTRTRGALETSANEEGLGTTFLNRDDIHLGAKEPVEDTARVLGRMFAAIAFRGHRQATLETLIACSGIPCINCLTERYHPTQALADLLTVRETCPRPPAETTLTYLGDAANNVARSLTIACALTGIHIRIAAPPERMLDTETLQYCRRLGHPDGITLYDDPIEAVRNSDAIYTDVWVSMGDEAGAAQRITQLRPYRVDSALMRHAPKAVFLHCLPAVRGNEVTAEIIDGPQSRVWQQAENRKHIMRALLRLLLAQ